MIKEVVYDPFGGIIKDTNPSLRVPIGFAGRPARPGIWASSGSAGGTTIPSHRPVDRTRSDWKIAVAILIGMAIALMIRSMLLTRWGWKAAFGAEVNKIGAGLGQLWDKAPAGIGEAVTKGAKGAGEALSKTADAFATNKDLQKYTGITLGAGALPIAAAAGTTAAPAIAAAAMQHPDKLAAASKATVDFASGFFDQSPPPMSAPGIGGYATRTAYDYIHDKQKRKE